MFQYSNRVREDDACRASFNALSRMIWGFDFSDWFENGHWGDLYIPHVAMDNGRVVANISVNLMDFSVNGENRRYIQLGTVMTHPEYRGRGLSRRLMEWVLAEYAPQAEGVYLFANDSVLDFYPRFGFVPASEFAYSLPLEAENSACPYQKETASLPDMYAALSQYACVPNENDGFYMSRNVNLYQFWMENGYAEHTFYLPENGGYVTAEKTGETLMVHQTYGGEKLDMRRLAASFGPEIREVCLGYTPACRDGYVCRPLVQPDNTLFILGRDLQRISRNRMRFPVLSHA